MSTPAPLSPDAFVDRLRTEGSRRYHHAHPFHVLMHEGRLTKHQLQQWVVNRYYYQTRIPLKDALILAKSEDPVFRRAWIHRIRDQDGDASHDGGLALWRRLAVAMGIDVEVLTGFHAVLPGVRQACDSYVALVRDASLLEAVAASLTELFAPDLMATRIAAWEQHYHWVDPQALAYFRGRVSQAAGDADQALNFVVSHATTAERQSQCLSALIRKTDILWTLLDCVYQTYVAPPNDSNDRAKLSETARSRPIAT